ncbi:hypothetical protein BaRGS_00011251 [Batillaria attramentaria]|uniref:Uncharacterized protein n=1 Tax=Batillaria attramentaria TaxID=370345 RepID=A0ABD0LEM0_9CAEN
MERRVAALFSSKSGNIFDLESEGIKELIEDYFAVSNSCEECDFLPEDSDEEEEFSCEDGATPGRSANEDEVSSPDFEDVETEQPVIRIAGEADSVLLVCSSCGIIIQSDSGAVLNCVLQIKQNRLTLELFFSSVLTRILHRSNWKKESHPWEYPNEKSTFQNSDVAAVKQLTTRSLSHLFHILNVCHPAFIAGATREAGPPLPQRVYYFNLGDVRRDMRKLPHQWTVLEDKQDMIAFGVAQDCTVTIRVNVLNDLATQVYIMGGMYMSATRLSTFGDSSLGRLPLSFNNIKNMHRCNSS